MSFIIIDKGEIELEFNRIANRYLELARERHWPVKWTLPIWLYY